MSDDVGLPLAGHWFLDWYIPGRDFHAHSIERTLATVQTRFQRVQIVDLHHLGRSLILDDKIQSAEIDEFVYHELLVHPVMLAHPRPRRVLLCGGGEGAPLREVLRHPAVESVTMVDIDEELVALCREHLASWQQGAFDDPRVTVLYDDARAFVERTRESFDVFINDISDPIQGGPATLLYTRQFYREVLRLLTPGGVFVTQAQGIHYDRYDVFHASIRRTAKDVFPQVRSAAEFTIANDYPWSYVLASTGPTLDLTVEDVDARLAARGVEGLRFYDGLAHQRAFSLPKYLRAYLDQEGKVIDDQDPMVVP